MSKLCFSNMLGSSKIILQHQANLAEKNVSKKSRSGHPISSLEVKNKPSKRGVETAAAGAAQPGASALVRFNVEHCVQILPASNQYTNNCKYVLARFGLYDGWSICRIFGYTVHIVLP